MGVDRQFGRLGLGEPVAKPTISAAATTSPDSNSGTRTKSVSRTAIDRAGNSTVASAGYSVVYKFSGFLQPIPMPVQSFKAGSTIPVKFQLRDANGVIVSTAAATLAVNSQASTPQGGANTGNSFRYDPTGQLYLYNLSTKGMTTGRTVLTVSLNDGTKQSVTVTLK